MYHTLEKINTRPAPFEYYTSADLWTDEHTAQQMLKYHLDESIDASSRNISFINKSVEWIVSRFGVTEGTAVADFGCGPGLYAARLAEQGASVTGIDFSENSLAYARKKAAEKDLAIDYIHTNYLNYETDATFDLIIMIMCDFCALSPDQRRILLKKFNSLLNPGGSVLLDVYSMNTFSDREECAFYEKNQLCGFWSPDDYYGFVNTFKYEAEKLLLDKYIIITEKWTREVYNWMQCFSRESLSAEFESAGLKVDDFYSDVAGREFDESSKEFAVVAGGIK